MRKLFILLFLSITLAPQAKLSNYSIISSCACEQPQPFVKSMSGAKLIALVKISHYTSYLNLAKDPGSMEVEVLKIFRGSQERKRINIFGSNGQLCRPYINKFKPNDLWILGLQEGCEQKPFCMAGETKSDFYIDHCTKLWLPVINDTVSGAIIQILNSNERMSLKNFEKLLNDK